MSLPTAFQPENCPSNRLPTGVPTAFQPPSKGVYSNPPITPRRLEAAFSGAWGPLGGSLRRAQRGGQSTMEATVSDCAEDRADLVDTAASQPSGPAPDLASEILEGPALNRKAHGLANANAIAVTVIGAALKFILNERGLDAAKREFADIGEAAIKFAGIENEGTRQ
jgi:hypothetical protein